MSKRDGLRSHQIAVEDLIEGGADVDTQLIAGHHNAGDLSALRDLIGIESVADYIIEHGLWSNCKAIFDQRLAPFSALGLSPPTSSKDIDSFVTEQVLGDKAAMTRILRRAGLIQEGHTVTGLETERVGEDHGFTGKLFRVKNILIKERDDESIYNSTIGSFIIKVCNAKWIKDPNSEAKFLLRIGSLYTNPVFPKCYLNLSHQSLGNPLPQESSFYMMLL